LALPDDLPPVLADAAQLELALKNLLENATKYSPPGTAIRVAGARAGGEVRLAVEDEGLGIPPEHLERVFERFFRLTGAGLPARPAPAGARASARATARAPGGRVGAETRPGGGARFVTALPDADSYRAAGGGVAPRYEPHRLRVPGGREPSADKARLGSTMPPACSVVERSPVQPAEVRRVRDDFDLND